MKENSPGFQEVNLAVDPRHRPSPAPVTFLRMQLTADIGPGFRGANTKPVDCYFLPGLVLFVCYVHLIYIGSLSASFV